MAQRMRLPGLLGELAAEFAGTMILILFGVVGGAVAFGVLGLFLGPTLLALGYELIREWNMAEAPEVQPSLAD